MNILYISTERGWHGGEEQLRLLAAAAASAGHSVHIAARAGGKFLDRSRSAGYDCVELPDHVRGLQALWRLRQTIKSFSPEVIHANDPHALWLMRWATTALWIPARVASRRVLFPIRSPGKYIHGCDRVLCVSRAIADVCRQSGVSDRLIAVVHDGVDPARMQSGDACRGRKSAGIDGEAPLILCVAQLAAYKGHRYLMEAMPRVLAAKPRAILALAGDGPLRAELEAQARALHVEGSVRFLGYRTDVPDLLAACDLAVLASPEEGLGTALLDAMFAGKPIAAADAGGIAEMLRNSQGELCGWPAAPRNPESLATSILAALDSPEESARRTETARHWAAEEFTAANMAARTLGEYERLLAAR